MAPDPDIVVAHVDHTSEAGGAEIALGLVLSQETPWRARLFVPIPEGGDGGPLSASRVSAELNFVGTSQPIGISRTLSPRVLLLTLWRVACMAWRLRLRPDFRQVDIVHTNSSRSALIGVLASLGGRQKRVVHLRDFVDVDALGKFGHWSLTRVALRACDGVIANSESVLASARPWLREKAVTCVIPSPVRPGALAPPRASSSTFTVGTVGRLTPWKGHEYMLRAVAAVAHTHEIRFRIIGGPLLEDVAFEQALRDLSRQLEIEDVVDFIGQVEPDAVVYELSQLDVALQYASRPEPLGQNVLQSLAAGVATIAASEGGPTEWIEHGVNGLLVRPRDSSALAGAISSLIVDPALRLALATQGPRTAGLPTVSSVIDEHFAFYERLLTGGSRLVADVQ